MMKRKEKKSDQFYKDDLFTFVGLNLSLDGTPIKELDFLGFHPSNAWSLEGFAQQTFV